MSKIERINKYKKFMGEILTQDVFIEKLDELGFFTAPASTKYHGAYEGGLFDHSLATAEALVELTEKLGLEWERQSSPWIVGMLHDLCKCDNYVLIRDMSTRYEYNSKLILDGHGEKSIIIIQKFMSLTDEEIACIRWHMGAFETDTKLWNYYGRAIEKYPNVLYTHTADMIASRIKGV
jgi:hypothetical protein